jgi:hypothetical protein
MQGPKRVVAAAMQPHPGGTELVVFFEPHEAGDFLETRVSRAEGELEQRGEVLKKMLIEKGWFELNARHLAQ